MFLIRVYCKEHKEVVKPADEQQFGLMSAKGWPALGIKAPGWYYLDEADFYCPAEGTSHEFIIQTQQGGDWPV